MPPRKRSPDDEYQYYMELAKTNPEQAGMEFMERLKSGKRTAKSMRNLRKLEAIMSGDQSAWHAAARSMTEAIQLLISSCIFKQQGMGVLGSGGRMESVVSDVANMISEDVDFVPMTPIQKRLKAIAESYGISAYVIR